MTKDMTLSFDEDIYSGLIKMGGTQRINAFISDLVRPYIVPSDLEAGYKAMAADEEHEREAHEWCNASFDAVTNETKNVYPGETIVTIQGERSKAMSNQIMPTDKGRLQNRIGVLTKADMRSVENAFKVHLSL